MIFKRSLQQELVFYTTAVYASLVLVTLTFTLIRLLGQASAGRIDPQAVFVLVAYAIVNYQALILSLSVFVGTLLVFTRMWRDSEMTIWAASGVGIARFVTPTLRFAWPVAIVAATFSMVVAPWANREATAYRESFDKRDDLARIAIGQFRESGSGQRVFYVESGNENSALVNKLFIAETRPAQGNVPAKSSVVVAQTGKVLNEPDGDRYLVLDQGRRYEQVANRAELQWMSFDSYRVLIAEKPPEPEGFVPFKLRNTFELVRDPAPAARGELLWRVAGPLMTLLLALLAVPLSYFNPRSGRATPMVASVLLFLIYINVVATAQNNVQQGKWAVLAGFLGPHMAVLWLALVLLAWRSQVWMRLMGRMKPRSRAVFSPRSQEPNELNKLNKPKGLNHV